jgi:hypothetical protein
MVQMGRMLRRLAAVLAGLALVAMLPAPCRCPESAATPLNGHECCVPPPGVSANDHACCDDNSAADADILTPGPFPAPSLSEAAVVWVEMGHPERAPRGAAFLAPSPPLFVLRI